MKENMFWFFILTFTALLSINDNVSGKVRILEIISKEIENFNKTMVGFIYDITLNEISTLWKNKEEFLICLEEYKSAYKNAAVTYEFDVKKRLTVLGHELLSDPHSLINENKAIMREIRYTLQDYPDELSKFIKISKFDKAETIMKEKRLFMYAQFKRMYENLQSLYNEKKNENKKQAIDTYEKKCQPNYKRLQGIAQQYVKDVKNCMD